MGSNHAKMLADHIRLADHIDSADLSEADAERLVGDLDKLDAAIIATPAATREDLIAKLVFSIQIITEDHELTVADAAALVAEAESLASMGRVSPYVGSLMEARS